MKKIALLLFMMIVLCSVSYATGFKTYVVEERQKDVQKDKFITFYVPHSLTGRQKLSCLIKSKESKRQFYLRYAEDEKTLDRCMAKITKNWKRDVTPEGVKGRKIVKGYDEDMDKKFRRKLWFKIRRGEKVCE